MNLLDLGALMLRLGMLSFGGGNAVIAEIQRELVDVRGVITTHDFAIAYALGQATPGPGMLYLIPLGYRLAGLAGGAVALVCFLAPPLVLQVVVAGQWERLRRNTWFRAADKTLVPISIGLLGAGLITLATPLLGEPAAVVGMGIAALAAMRFRVSPAVIVLGAGALGLAGVL